MIEAQLTNKPRAHASSLEVKRRIAALSGPHTQLLVAWVEDLRRRFPDSYFPDFDPLGGGGRADTLFLYEKPGPKTDRRNGGSGFISTCNDDPTAEASWHFMRQAGIDLSRTVHWNVISGWDGTIKTNSAELELGKQLLLELLDRLPNLKVVVLVGRKARSAEALVRSRGVPVVNSAHPGPKVRSINPHLWNEIPGQWAQAREIADSQR